MATETGGRELSSRQFFVQRWEQEYPAFVSVFRALPPDRLDYRPHPQSRSAGELVGLMVSAQESCIQLCASRKSMYSGLRWQESSGPGTLAERIDAYERGHESLAAQLRSMDDAGWSHPAWLIQGTEEILLKDTVGGLLMGKLEARRGGIESPRVGPSRRPASAVFGGLAISTMRQPGQANDMRRRPQYS